MKKVIAVLAVTTILFFGLWIRAVTDHYTKMEELCQSYAEQAVGHLAEYEKFKDINGESHIGQYWGSVSIFYTFKETLYLLPDNGGWNEARYKICDVVYDHMIFAPDEVISHLDEVLAALEPIGEDFTRHSAWGGLSELSYNLQYVWE